MTGVRRGVYENRSASVARRRAAVLDQKQWLALPDGVEVRSGSLIGLAAQPALVFHDLQRQGMFVAVLDRAPEAEEVLQLGATLGPVLPEDDELALSFAAHGGKVLTLKTAFDSSADIASQPFSTAPLRLHTESSTSRPENQPRFILLACTAAPARDHGLQTLVVPTARVLAALSAHTLAVLRAISPDEQGAPAVLRTDERDVVCFRDFSSPWPWVSTRDVKAVEAEQALDALLLATYDPAHVRGAEWQRDMLVVLDNTALMHGRTAGPARPEDTARTLQRVCVGWSQSR